MEGLCYDGRVVFGWRKGLKPRRSLAKPVWAKFKCSTDIFFSHGACFGPMPSTTARADLMLFYFMFEVSTTESHIAQR